MPFRFSLQPVLNHRQTREDQLQRHFNEAKAQLEALKDRLRQIEDDIERQRKLIASGLRHGLSFALRELYELWIEDQKEAIGKLQLQIDQMATETERRRQRLIQAMKDRTIIEKLREQEFKAWRLNEARAEQRLFDEIAVRNFCTGLKQEKNAAQAERIAR